MKHSIIIFVLLYCIWGVSPTKGMSPNPLVDEDVIEHELNMPTPTSAEEEPVQGCEMNDDIIPIGKTVNETLCRQCKCIENGNLKCTETDCPKPYCVDFKNVEDDCCQICPNGKNCYTPNNIILKEGETTSESGLKCRCIFSEKSLEKPRATCEEE